MGATCVNCKESIGAGQEYLSYGGMVWCDLTCIAEWYVRRHARWEDPTDAVPDLYQLDDEKVEDIEQNHEWKTVPE